MANATSVRGKPGTETTNPVKNTSAADAGCWTERQTMHLPPKPRPGPSAPDPGPGALRGSARCPHAAPAKRLLWMGRSCRIRASLQ